MTINAVFTRHGEKEYDPNNPETGLTDNGVINSYIAGRKREEADVIKPYSSRTSRTKETAEFEVVGSPTENKGKHRFREELGFPFDPQGDFASRMNEIKKEIVGDNYSELSESEFKERLKQAATAQTDYYLNFGNEKPDSLAPAPIEAAANIAKMVKDYSHMAEHLDSGSKADLINASHDLNLSAFLKEALVREVDQGRVVGLDSINDIGGPINFNEHLEILIRTDANGKKDIKLLFRGQEYEVDNGRLEELAALSTQNKNEDNQSDN